MSQPAPPPVLAVRGLRKSYPGVVAVDDATLEIAPGEVHGLVGENGAGKSTLIKILAGVVRADAGQIEVDGQPIALHSVHDAGRHGLAFIHQELSLVPYFDAAENIFLGRPYPHTAWGALDRRTLRRRAGEALARLGVRLPLDLPAGRLSPGQQTMLAVARAFIAPAPGAHLRLLVMDEPTASLTDQEIGHLYEVIRTLRGEGVAVLYVSHRLQEIFDLTDRVTVMRNGRVVAAAPTETLDRAALIRLMTGRDEAAPRRRDARARGAPLLEAEGLAGESVAGISFTLHAGEVLGIAGLVGAGRSSLLRLIAGADARRGGSLRLDGVEIRPTSPRAALRLGIALAPEERRSQGLVLGRPVYQNITLSHLARYLRGGLIDRGRELAAARRLGDALHLKAPSLLAPVAQLSGGNQQKVVLARCLAGEGLRVLLLDEPTRGVDVGARRELYEIMAELAAQGVGVLLVSSELPELLALSDRVLVMHEGRPTATLDAASADPATVLAHCYGG